MKFFITYLTVFGLMFASALQYAFSNESPLPKFNPNPNVTAEGDEAFNHGQFFEVKEAAKTAIEYTAKKYGGETYDHGKLKGFIADTTNLLASLKKEYPTIEYAVVGDTEVNSMEILQKGNMFVTTVVEYKDEKDTITWEFQTVFSPNAIDFYVTLYDGKPKSFEDYYHYNHLQKKVKTDDGHKDS